LRTGQRLGVLSGRNHHSVGMGGITEIGTSAPGYNSMRPNTCAPLAEILKLNGYSTAQFGKCHEVPVFEATPIGPCDHRPTGSGFEHFYGFIGGENNQYCPELYDGTTPIVPPRTPEEGYHLMEDLADKAIGYIHQQKAIAPDKPFFGVSAAAEGGVLHDRPGHGEDGKRGRRRPAFRIDDEGPKPRADVVKAIKGIGSAAASVFAGYIRRGTSIKAERAAGCCGRPG
jgi:arylsulfatase A-like enzyme